MTVRALLAALAIGVSLPAHAQQGTGAAATGVEAQKLLEQQKAPIATNGLTDAEYHQLVVTSSAQLLQSSRAALDKSRNERVRVIAEGVTQEQQRLTETMKSAGAATRGTEEKVSPAVNTARETVMQRLEAASGPDFDRQFVRAQSGEYEALIRNNEAYARSGRDPELTRIAREMLPALQQRLAALRDLAGELG